MQERHSSQDVGSLNMAFNDLQISTERAIFKRFHITEQDIKNLSNALIDDYQFFSRSLNCEQPEHLLLSTVTVLSSKEFRNGNSSFFRVFKTIREKVENNLTLSTYSKTFRNPIYATTLAAFDSILLTLEKLSPETQKNPCHLNVLLFHTTVQDPTVQDPKNSTINCITGLYLLLQKAWENMYTVQIIDLNILYTEKQIAEELVENYGKKFEKIPYQDQELQCCYQNIFSF